MNIKHGFKRTSQLLGLSAWYTPDRAKLTVIVQKIRILVRYCTIKQQSDESRSERKTLWIETALCGCTCLRNCNYRLHFGKKLHNFVLVVMLNFSVCMLSLREHIILFRHGHWPETVRYLDTLE